ncbi:MAG: proline--tRNA ligase [Clostridia bacterium]
MERLLKEITPRTEDYSQWYLDVINKADLMDYAPVRGFMVIKPYAYRIWELIQAYMDERFRETGHQNAYFPLLIPESLFTREADHVEGFSPEVAWVTRGGSEELTEPLAIRPTSETITGIMYARWIQSYRDLPVLINQWCNVLRWEKATRPFVRPREFLWQEGHTVHRTELEAREETRRMLGIYLDTVQNVLAIPALAGQKSERERFAGAVETWALEALMGDGRALQAATSHFLGQNFSRVFEIDFLDEDGERRLGWTTSWGASIRLIGAIIMVHGDDRGLRLPPRVAPIQVVVVPIAAGPQREQVMEAARQAGEELKTFRVTVDDRPEYTPGWKFNDWEMRGVPVRVEIGPRDLAQGQVVLVRRDTGAKVVVPRNQLAMRVNTLLEEVQQGLLEQALAWRDAHTYTISSMEGILEHQARGFFRAGWCGRSTCEDTLQAETGATLRVVEDATPEGVCLVCQAPAVKRAIFARAY